MAEQVEKNDVTVLAGGTETGSEHQNHEKELCAACKELNLSVAQFIVPSAPTKQARRDILSFRLKSSTSKHRLGTLEDIYGRSKEACPFCNLIIRSLSEPNYEQDGKAVCYVTWELDGREVTGAKRYMTGRDSEHDSWSGRTRRLHLMWDDRKLEDSYLAYVPVTRYSITTSDAQRVWGKESLFLGRRLILGGNNQALVNSWLDLCQEKHMGPCAARNEASEKKFRHMMMHSYFGVIDVLNMQLTRLPFTTDSKYNAIPEPYVALSYVWGQGTAYTTTKENVMLLRTHGGVESIQKDLPQVIRDSIDLVHRLGLRYIWIDALCIVQDSPRSWKLNAYNMDLIYGNATLTICAADGDASVGLKAMHSSQHNDDQTIEICTSVGLQAIQSSTPDNLQVKEVRSPIHLMVTRPPEMYIRKSKWNTRAWTFQERLLSQRCLIFTNGRVYFQCRSTGMSEDIFADREGAGWSLDLVDAPMQMFKQVPTRAIWVYMKCVELYSSRELSKPKDILAAFSGMSNLLKQTMRSPFIYGLPSSHFDLALLWEPIQAAKRRKTEESRETRGMAGVENGQAVNGDEKQEGEFEGMEFPSWCWSGWMNSTRAYKDSMVGGCLENVSSWLEKHTWIKWYVRDGYGDLIPLWDREASKVDLCTEKKWRGYKSGQPAWKYEPGWRTRLWEQLRKYEKSPERVSPSRVHVEPEEQYRRRDTRFGKYDDYPENLEREREPERARYSTNVKTGYRSTYQQESLLQERDLERSRSRYYPRDERSANFQASAPPSKPQPPVHNRDFFDMVFESPDGGAPEDIEASPKFHITLREYPYLVVMGSYDPDPEKEVIVPQMPILQFWTWQTFLNVHHSASADDDDTTPPPQDAPGAGLLRCHIADDVGDWCGSIVLQREWVEEQTSAEHEFIAISGAKNFTGEECGSWTYYIPKEREDSEWDLYYVLLIHRQDEKWERIGLGKVFKRAFRKAKWKEIMLG